MTRLDVVQLLGDEQDTFRRTADSAEITSAHDKHALHLTYGTDNRVKQITVFVPNEAFLGGIQILGVPLEQVRAQTAKRGFLFQEVDAGLWCEGARVMLISVDGTVDGVEVYAGDS